MSSTKESTEAASHDFVVVANRLPVDRVEGPDGELEWRPSPGGLVTALEPVMRKAGGAWVGWSGDAGPAPEPFEADGMHLVGLALSETRSGTTTRASPTPRCGRSTTTSSRRRSSTGAGGRRT